MRKMQIHKPGLIRCVSIVAVGLFTLSTQAAPATKEVSVAFIPKGTTQLFWKTVHAGAAKAAQEEGVKLFWDGPQKDDDRQGQIQMVQNYTSRGMDAIILIPQDSRALVAVVKAAEQRGVKVIIVNSKLEGEEGKDYLSFVATDNYNAGKQGGKRMSTLLKRKGNVAVLRFFEGSESTTQRENGFLDGLKDAKDVQIISSNQYAGVGVEKAFQAAQNLLNRYPDLNGIFCPNESVCNGVLRALDVQKKSGLVTMVGFDASEVQREAMKAGKIQGLLVQAPFDQGYQGVKVAAAAIRGKPFKKHVDTGVKLITPENLSDAKIQEYMFPDIKKWLGE